VPPSRAVAVSVAGQCHGLVLVGRCGQVLRPAKLWNDTTSSQQASRMVANLGAPQWASIVGSVPTAAMTITKLAWVAEHEPEVLDRTAHVLLPHDWMTFQLTGEQVTDRSEASGTGYYAVAAARWRTDLLDRFVRSGAEWASLLPRVAAPAEVVGTVRPEVAADLGLGPGVAVGPGAGDQHAGVVGLGAGPGDLVVSLGTSGVVMVTCDRPVHDGSGWVDGVCDATGRYLPLVCTLNAAKVTDAAARWLGVDHDGLAALALAAPDSDSRPVMAAYLDGERSPDRPRARGAIAGLTPDTSRAELALAAVEGVVLGLAEGIDAIMRLGVPMGGRVIVTGGAAASPAYRLVLADVVGREVERREVGDATARGAAAQAAAVAAGASIDEVRDAWAPRPLSVDTARHRDMATVRMRYRALAGCEGLDL